MQVLLGQVAPVIIECSHTWLFKAATVHQSVRSAHAGPPAVAMQALISLHKLVFIVNRGGDIMMGGG
jgi:hypothetical protein